MQIPSLKTYLQIPTTVVENLVKNEWEMSVFRKIEECAKKIDTCLELIRDLDWQFKIVRDAVQDLKNIALIDPEFPSVTKPELCPGISVLMQVYDTLEKRRIFLFENMESAFNSLDKSAGDCKQFAVINYSNADDIASVSESNLSKKKQLIGDLQMEMYRRIQNLENVHDYESWESVLQRIEEKRKICFQNVDAEKTTDESKMTDDSFQYSYSGNILDEMTNEQSKVNQNSSPSLKEESVNNVEEDLEHCRKVKKVKLTISSPGFENENKENISGSFEFRSLKSEDMFSSEGKLCVLKLSQDNTVDGMTTEEELILSLPKSSATISQIGENFPKN